MSNTKTIIVTIDPDGNSSLELDGFDGISCLQETKGLEEALGKTSSRTMKQSRADKTQIADKTKVG